MRAILLTGLVAATAGAAPLTLPRDAGAQPATAGLATRGTDRPEPRTPADTSRVRLAIAGMTCGSCATTARLALQRVAGVYRAEVSYDSAGAEVWYDSTRTSPERFIARLRHLTGYEARVVEEPARKEQAGGGSGSLGKDPPR